MKHQFINGPDGKRAFAVIPYSEYLQMIGDEGQASSSLLSEDGLFITLPHGGEGARLDVHQFVDVWARRGTYEMLAVNKRRQAFEDFKERHAQNGLDAVLRRCFLPEDSPYKNTMQATNAVVDALVETGIFSRTVAAMQGFYRPVQCIKIDEQKAMQFLRQHGVPKVRIDPHRFCIP